MEDKYHTIQRNPKSPQPVTLSRLPSFMVWHGINGWKLVGQLYGVGNYKTTYALTVNKRRQR
jgi:hypothetical protein